MDNLIIGGIVTILILIASAIFYTQTKKKLDLTALHKTEANSNAEMIKRLKHFRMITTSGAENAFKQVDRANYVDPSAGNPYAESALPIGYNATISAPHMHGVGLDLLVPYLKPGSKVLDIGSGSGFMSACFATLVGPTGHVYGIDHIQELVDGSIVNVNKKNSKLMKSITFAVGDGFEGLPESGPYDVIYFGAAAPELPKKLLKQLKIGGALLAPVGPPNGFHQLLKADLIKEGDVKVKNFGSVRFVPLTSKSNQIQGVDRGGIARMVAVDSRDPNGSNYLVLPHIVPAPDSSPSEYNIVLKTDNKKEV